MPDLAALAERLEKASGPDRELDVALMQAFDNRGQIYVQEVSDYTSSIDAALALVEKVLPGWHWTVDNGKPPNKPARAGIHEHFDYDARGAQGYAPTPPLAILVALLRAISKGPDHD